MTEWKIRELYGEAAGIKHSQRRYYTSDDYEEGGRVGILRKAYKLGLVQVVMRAGREDDCYYAVLRSGETYIGLQP